MEKQIRIYTDGSCHTQHRIGAWAAIIFIGSEKIVLSGISVDTTHQRMELTGAIMALNYVGRHFDNIFDVDLYSDSQYLTRLMIRSQKMASNNFISANGNVVRNIDLVQKWVQLHDHFSITTHKVRAHQILSDQSKYNIEADKLSRNLVRREVGQIKETQIL